MSRYNTPAKKGKSSLMQAPSTTPNVPPPTWLTAKSTTPAGNPPDSSRIFGSSYANNTFGSNRFSRPKGGFAVPESSPPPSDEDEDEDEMDADGDELDDEDIDIGQLDRDVKSPAKSAFMSSIGTPRGMKRSRDGQPREASNGDMAGIARGFARDAPAAGISGPDEVVLRTEEIISGLANDRRRAPERADELATSAAGELSRLWIKHGNSKTLEGAIGPESEEPLDQAIYLASLLIQIYTPHTIRPSSVPPVARPNRTLSQPKQQAGSVTTTIPRALLDWLNAHHNPLPDDFNKIHMYQPSPSASQSFWDIIFAELVRGKFTRAIRLLKDAGWEHAISAEDDGGPAHGYEGLHLDYANEVVDQCIAVLESCPGAKAENWDVKGTEWQMFRRRVKNAMQELEALAKESADPDELGQSRGNKNIFAQSEQSLAASTMRANSRVPWTVYENLTLVYRTLLGDYVIVDLVQDFLEAAVLLTVWWDGENADELVQMQSLRQSRRGANGAATREVDITPSTAYRRRLHEAFKIASEEPDFEVNTIDPMQVGLACVLEGGVEEVVGLVRTMHPSVATAVVDLASIAGWWPQSGRGKSRGMLQEEGFSSEDLMVLSHGPGQQKQGFEGVEHDAILSEYANMLAEREAFRDSENEREGWELAASVLGRLDDREVAQTKISGMFEQMEFEDSARVDKVLELCAEMGLGEQAMGIAEVRSLIIASMSFSLTLYSATPIHSPLQSTHHSKPMGLHSSTTRAPTRHRNSNQHSPSSHLCRCFTRERCPPQAIWILS